jgi:hypothetical protein
MRFEVYFLQIEYYAFLNKLILMDTSMIRSLFRKTLVALFIIFSTSSFASFDLDVDDNGDTDALTDGLLVLRHMFGLSGDTLALGVVGSEAVDSDWDGIGDSVN